MFPQTLQLSFQQLGYILGFGFILGVGTATIIGLHLVSGIRIKVPERPCPERYK